jgi:cytochrome P450 / NADPH-cytochrome P450 reductase
MAEPNYELKMRQTLTIKPVGWHLKARLRPGKSLYTGIVPSNPSSTTSDGHAAKTTTETAGGDLAPLAILYGSNAGSCKTFAEQIQQTALFHGLKATIATLDSATEHIPTDRPVVIVTPSYEGQPADNAKGFVAWLEANRSDVSKLKGVKYGMFSNSICLDERNLID